MFLQRGWVTDVCLVFAAYILGGEELHASCYLEGKAQQVIKGQGFQVFRLLV